MPDTDRLYDELRERLRQAGPAEAVGRLCDELRTRGDYGNLFYALLMRKRVELGVSPVPTGPATDLPAEVHGAYEDAIREAGREAGRLFLEKGDIPRAWNYFRMLGEPGPVAEALERYRPADGDDPQAVIEVAFQQGANPRKGFDLILDRYGICTAITMTGGYDFPHGPEVRAYCIRRLVLALYDQLQERLRSEVARESGTDPGPSAGVDDLLAGRDWLFADGMYHVDTSHLSSVVQMAMQLPPGSPELFPARALCRYGQRLHETHQFNGDPPFDQLYRDVEVYLDALAGERVDEAIAHFRGKIAGPDPDGERDTFPAEVLVNLLLKLGRPDEALAVAREHLSDTAGRQLSCPSVFELCQQARDFSGLADAARRREDPVHYLAGLIAASGA
jgi:hypothetical protein